jgi:IclR family acetate operon transcriptional repressor
MSNTPSSGDGHPSSVDNALRLLRLLSSQPSVRVADAAASLGIARSTAHRLLTALKDNQFAAQDKANSSYRVGAVLTEIGLATIRRLDIRTAAAPVLRSLRDETGETVSLSVLEGHNVRFVDCLEGTRAVRVGDRTGVVLPCSATAGGKAILAALPAADLALRFPDEILPAPTEASTATLTKLRTELDEIRPRRYAINLEESESGISAVAVAVCDPTRIPLGAIAIVVPAGRFERASVAQWLPVLFQGVLEIEATLSRTT